MFKTRDNLRPAADQLASSTKSHTYTHSRAPQQHSLPHSSAFIAAHHWFSPRISRICEMVATSSIGRAGASAVTTALVLLLATQPPAVVQAIEEPDCSITTNVRWSSSSDRLCKYCTNTHERVHTWLDLITMRSCSDFAQRCMLLVARPTTYTLWAGFEKKCGIGEICADLSAGCVYLHV